MQNNTGKRISVKPEKKKKLVKQDTKLVYQKTSKRKVVEFVI